MFDRFSPQIRVQFQTPVITRIFNTKLHFTLFAVKPLPKPEAINIWSMLNTYMILCLSGSSYFEDYIRNWYHIVSSVIVYLIYIYKCEPFNEKTNILDSAYNINPDQPKSMPRRLTRADTFRLLWIFCFRNHYSILLSPWDEMFWPWLACADCCSRGTAHITKRCQ